MTNFDRLRNLPAILKCVVFVTTSPVSTLQEQTPLLRELYRFLLRSTRDILLIRLTSRIIRYRIAYIRWKLKFSQRSRTITVYILYRDKSVNFTGYLIKGQPANIHTGQRTVASTWLPPWYFHKHIAHDHADGWWDKMWWQQRDATKECIHNYMWPPAIKSVCRQICVGRVGKVCLGTELLWLFVALPC